MVAERLFGLIAAAKRLGFQRRAEQVDPAVVCLNDLVCGAEKSEGTLGQLSQLGGGGDVSVRTCTPLAVDTTVPDAGFAASFDGSTEALSLARGRASARRLSVSGFRSDKASPDAFARVLAIRVCASAPGRDVRSC